MIKKVKAWLTKNHLTDDPNDMTAVVKSEGSIDPSGIIDELIKEGMETKKETALDVVTRFNRKVIELAQDGYSVNSGLVYIRAIIKGVFFSKIWNPAIHSVTFAVNMGLALRKAASEMVGEIQGTLSDPMVIFTLTDAATGEVNSVITPGEGVTAVGTYLKITTDPGDGIYLQLLSGGAREPIPGSKLLVNDPSKLVFNIPSHLAQGEYRLILVSHFSRTKTPLKEARTYEFEYILVVQ
jgi:hypothetical protein